MLLRVVLLRNIKFQQQKMKQTLTVSILFINKFNANNTITKIQTNKPLKFLNTNNY